MKKHLVSIILVSILLVGLCLLLYPTVSNWWNSFHMSRAVASYVEAVENMEEDEYERILQTAEQYNKRVSENGIHWHLTDEEKAEYESILDISGTGIMGYITIPGIKVELPIYHGTEDVVLQIAVGHIEGTSLPVGGAGSHCVLSGHRGLPSARLFTDLDKLVEGDVFTITVLNEVLTYQVDQIRIVLPDELQELQISAGQDYCTLVTCTPYGINSHRLLVRGHRIETVEEHEVKAEAYQINTTYVAGVLAVILVVILLLIFLIRNAVQSRRRKKRCLRAKDADRKHEKQKE